MHVQHTEKSKMTETDQFAGMPEGSVYVDRLRMTEVNKEIRYSAGSDPLFRAEEFTLSQNRAVHPGAEQNSFCRGKAAVRVLQ